jgi:hypothetical protein
LSRTKLHAYAINSLSCIKDTTPKTHCVIDPKRALHCHKISKVQHALRFTTHPRKNVKVGQVCNSRGREGSEIHCTGHTTLGDIEKGDNLKRDIEKGENIPPHIYIPQISDRAEIGKGKNIPQQIYIPQISDRAENERLEQEERLRRERELAQQKLMSGDDEGDGGGFAFSQMKVKEMMTIAPAQQISQQGL